MLALPGPYGWDAKQGIRISLRTDYDDFDPVDLNHALQEFGCHRPAIPKIFQCLMHSGRYDCIVRYAWLANDRKWCSAMMAEARVEIVVLEVIEDNPSWKEPFCDYV